MIVGVMYDGNGCFRVNCFLVVVFLEAVSNVRRATRRLGPRVKCGILGVLSHRIFFVKGLDYLLPTVTSSVNLSAVFASRAVFQDVT